MLDNTAIKAYEQLNNSNFMHDTDNIKIVDGKEVPPERDHRTFN